MLDQSSDHVLVHTGQNFSDELSRVFFEELAIRTPDHDLKIREEVFATQFARLIEGMSQVIDTTRPDRMLSDLHQLLEWL